MPHVDNVVDSLVDRGEIFKLGNPEEQSVQDLASVLPDICGVPQRVVHLPLPPDDPWRRRPDIARAAPILGRTSRTPLAEGLCRAIAHFGERNV